MFIDGLDVDKGTLPHIGYRGTGIVFLHSIISPSEPNLNYRRGLYSSFR